MTLRTRVAGEEFALDAADVEPALAAIDPEPIKDHFVVVGRHRYPPKQVLAVLTGLDRADFTTHQARSILRRLGFGVHRRHVVPTAPAISAPPRGPEDTLGSYAGRWVGQDESGILFHADSPQEVLRWLRKNGLRARVWRIPANPAEAGSMLSTP